MYMIFGICITVISGLLITVLLQNAMGNISVVVNAKSLKEKEGDFMVLKTENTEEKTIPEKDRMSLVDALCRLHMLRDILADPDCDFATLYGLYVEAFDRVFEHIDEMGLLFEKIGGKNDV